MSSTSSVTLVKDSTAPRNISMNQEREMRHISPADAMPPPQPDDPPKAEGLNVGHEYTLSHAGVGKQLASSIASTQSIYWSARSIVRSVFTDSTGFRLLPGATWKEDLYRSMNSGFGSGAPRDQNYRSVGREAAFYQGLEVWDDLERELCLCRRDWRMLWVLNCERSRRSRTRRKRISKNGS